MDRDRWPSLHLGKVGRGVWVGGPRRDFLAVVGAPWTVDGMLRVRLFSGRSGFTLVELVVTCVVLGILAAVAVVTYSKVTDTVTARSDSMYLLRAELAADNLAANTGYQLPQTLASALAVPGLTFTTGLSSGPQNISVDWVSGTEVLFADLAGDHVQCLVLVDNLAGATTWGSDPGAGATACSAGDASADASSITSRTPTAPSVVSW